LRDDKFVRLDGFLQKDAVAGRSRGVPIQAGFGGSFMFAFGWRTARHPSSLPQKVNEKMRFDKA
jgi:hypothetical protein